MRKMTNLLSAVAELSLAIATTLPVASETSTRQEAALLVVFYRDENQTARRHARMKDVNSYQRLTGLSKGYVARLGGADCNGLPIRAPSVPVGHF